VNVILDDVATRGVVFAPNGRDAAVAVRLLEEAGIPADICFDIYQFQRALSDSACFAVATEEALRSADLRGIVGWVAGQASWSDFPFLILTRRGGGPDQDPDVARLLDLLGNVTFLERPFHPTTFASVARTALKSRQRQYDARTRIDELYEGEERLRTALQAGHLGSWELNLNSWVLTASPVCKGIYGYGPDEPMSYEQLLAAVHPDDRTSMTQAINTSSETGADYAIDYRTVWRDGSTHWAESQARLVWDRFTDITRLAGVSSDITSRKTDEARLRQLNETLEERVKQRTAELVKAHRAVLGEIEQRERAEEQFRQAQKMETIGQITGGVAHDFNNLLMAVMANLDLLRKHVPDDARLRRLIDGAMQGAKRGATLTQRLLAFARRQELHIEARSLVEVVKGMKELLERSVGQQIELHIELPVQVAPTLLDANQIELALLNLVVNARDAMPEGGLLTIRVDECETAGSGDLPPGRYVRLSARDTGQGMDSETLVRATEPFFSTKELGKGTGLGLSMIQGLALQLNGALRLSSEPGRGTLAELWLPVTAAAAAHPPAREVSYPGEDATAGVTILVVDDDPLIAMSTVDMLEDLGHQVIEARSGPAALAILRNGNKVDLMITDYSMPKMTGMQLAAAARALRPELPILLATGYAELPPGGSDLELPRLAKPYMQETVAAEIAKLLRPAPRA
jgi:PAS domain S-box-containing protein